MANCPKCGHEFVTRVYRKIMNFGDFTADGGYEVPLVCGHIWRRTPEQVRRYGGVSFSDRKVCEECTRLKNAQISS